MVPWGGRAIKLEVVDIFHVSRDLVIGGVDESLVKVDKEYKLPIRHKPAQVFTSKRGCFTFAHLCCFGHATSNFVGEVTQKSLGRCPKQSLHRRQNFCKNA